MNYLFFKVKIQASITKYFLKLSRWIQSINSGIGVKAGVSLQEIPFFQPWRGVQAAPPLSWLPSHVHP